MSEFICTTIVDFEDGTKEGQVLHVGAEKECQKVADMIPGVAYNGPRRTLGACVCVLPNTAEFGGPFTTGERWQMAPPPPAVALPSGRNANAD